MKRKNLLFVSLLSLLLVVPCFTLKAEEGIEPAVAAYQCIKCGSHEVLWNKHYWSNWENAEYLGSCPDGKCGYVHILQKKYYNYYLSCSACGADFKDGEERFDTKVVCVKG